MNPRGAADVVRARRRVPGRAQRCRIEGVLSAYKKSLPAATFDAKCVGGRLPASIGPAEESGSDLPRHEEPVYSPTPRTRTTNKPVFIALSNVWDLRDASRGCPTPTSDRNGQPGDFGGRRGACGTVAWPRGGARRGRWATGWMGGGRVERGEERSLICRRGERCGGGQKAAAGRKPARRSD